MALFVLDTDGDTNLLKQEYENQFTTANLHQIRGGGVLDKKPNRLLLDELPSISHVQDFDYSDDEDDGNYYGLPPPNVDLTKIIETALAVTEARKSKAEYEMERTNELVNVAASNAQDHPLSRRGRVTDLDYSDFNETSGKFDEEKTRKSDIKTAMSQTKIIDGFEKLKDLPSLTKKTQRCLRRVERSKTKGAGWYNLPTTEVTEDVKNDLMILQMRSALDPKHFYKKNDLKVLPKYFQIGTVQHSALYHYDERNSRRNKERSLVEELMADEAVQKYTKRKYQEVIARNDKYAHRRALKKMKKLKNNK